MPSPQFNLIVLRATDIDRSAAFYELLDLHFIKHEHGKGPQHYSAEVGEMVFEIYPATATQQASTSARIGFAVDDVDHSIEKLAAYPGAKLVAAPADSEWGRRAVVADPDGHRVELVTKSPPANT